jgi:hypothetical protein
MSSNTNHRFIWSYPFFFYTLLKHYRKEKHGVSDIAPWMSLCFMMMWSVSLYMSVVFFLLANCYPDFLDVRIFPEQYDWFNGAAIGTLFFIPSAIFFLGKKRYRDYEDRFDALPTAVKKRGHKISWVVLWSGFALTFLMMWWFANSTC